ncbi:MAG TPA: ankyrin repeat domain-containing protein [Vicinamibacterales bacterium]|nr:ankyrin repeat domain-containing protein [Vicinamibacterales bacterium]
MLSSPAVSIARAIAVAATVALAASSGYAQTTSASAKASAGQRPSTTRGADVNRRGVDGSTPLQWAVYNGDVAETRRLLRAGANVALANSYGATPMTLAAEVANTDILKVLLEAGANADSPNPEGQTALMTVARTGNVEAAKLLLDHGATVDAKEKWGGQTALMWASARRHPEMMQLLISKGADVNAASIDRDYQRHVTAEGRPKSLDSGGLTPLLYAARENCSACVNVLLENKVDIDLPDPDGASPLLVAIMNANWDLAKQLIAAGADVNQWDIFGESPLLTAVDLRSRIDGGHASIDPQNGTTGLAIVTLLLERGANPNMQLFFKPANVRGAVYTRGSTPLIRAAVNNDLEIVKLLLEHGADATLSTADRQTPIHAVLAGRAPENQALELIKVLQKAGTDVNVIALINHEEEIRGGTVLHYAVRKRYKEVIKLLASFKIDMDAVDQDGLTALDYTQSRGFMPFMALQTPIYKDEAALLRELGATKLMAKSPEWPVLGPPQGVWEDIWPLGESRVHEPVYKPKTD